MKDVFKKLEVDGVQYPFCFNINVIEEIQEEYGDKNTDGFTKWANMIDVEDSMPSMKAIKFMLKSAINEGIDIENEEKGEKRQFLTEKQIGRLISKMGDGALVSVMGIVAESNASGDPIDSGDTEKN